MLLDLAAAFVFAIGSVICHQLPDRSFFIDGQQLPVCARCTGLYLSGAAGAVAWWGGKIGRGWTAMTLTPRRALAVVSLAAVPTVLSYTSGVLGIWDGSNATRAVLALPLGLAAGAVVAAVSTKDLR
jgi:uncharacterized membrane protein